MGSLWSGVSGLNAYAQGIAVIGNNLANVNTVGYKSSRILFSDMLSEMAGGTSDASQVGTGVTVGTIALDYTAGGLQTGQASTDLAVNGSRGYFQVRNADEDTIYYTRAGNFRFDKDGYLNDPNGFRLQGWAADQAALQKAQRNGETLSEVPVTGSQTDIQIKNFELPALSTSSVTMITNLDSLSEVGAKDATDPYFTTFKGYNASNTPPVSNASYSTSIKVYDAAGGSHDLDVYYTKVKNENGKEYWEYTVATDPADDGRSATSSTTKAGVVMIGTLTFSSEGVLENQTAYTLSSGASDPTQLSSWTQAQLTSKGVPQFSIAFRSASNASTVLPSQTIAFKTGLEASNASWNSNNPTTAAGIGTSAAANAGFDPSKTHNAVNSTTNYATSSYTLAQSQDGYPKGELLETSVDANGVLYGEFSNGRTQALYVLAMADFINPTDLRREGNNLFSATAESGAAQIGRAGSGTYDTISGNSLESSNVDMATQMVSLITTQRAFEANSKVVNTADAMMQKALDLKR